MMAISKSCNDAKSKMLLRTILTKVERRMRSKLPNDVLNNKKIMDLYIELNDSQVAREAWPFQIGQETEEGAKGIVDRLTEFT